MSSRTTCCGAPPTCSAYRRASASSCGAGSGGKRHEIGCPDHRCVVGNRRRLGQDFCRARQRARPRARLGGAATGRPWPTIFTADLERRDGASVIAAELSSRGLEPAIVVNNAGFGLRGEAAALSHDGQLAMIDVNVRALTELSLMFVDSVTRHRGGILNVASVAAFLPGPGMAVYYASKTYVLSFSEALHRELSDRGVRVTALCPGPVPTEF